MLLRISLHHVTSLLKATDWRKIQKQIDFNSFAAFLLARRCDPQKERCVHIQVEPLGRIRLNSILQ